MKTSPERAHDDMDIKLLTHQVDAIGKAVGGLTTIVNVQQHLRGIAKAAATWMNRTRVRWLGYLSCAGQVASSQFAAKERSNCSDNSAVACKIADFG